MNKKSLLRTEMETKRLEMKKLLDKVEIDLLQFDKFQLKCEQFQKLASQKRLLIKEINGLTIGIKHIKEMEVDEEVIKEMDDTYRKLESGELTIEDLHKMMEEKALADDDTTWMPEDKEEPKDLLNATDEDISNSIDDLLDNL